MQNETETLTPSSSIRDDIKREESNYIIELNDALFFQIENQVNFLKKHDIRHSLQSWTLEAIREKMILEKKSGISKVSKQKILKLIISERLRQYIENRVLEIKAIRRSYSKKKWILDAITEKIDRDKNQFEVLNGIYSTEK